jgi:hypothetical protein
MLSLVAVFINEHHPDILDLALDSSPAGSDSGGSPYQDRISSSSRFGNANNSSSLDPSHQLVDASAGSASRLTGPQTEGTAALAAGQGDRCEGPGGPDTDLDDDDMDTESVRYSRPADTSDWQPFDYALHR